MCFAHPPCPEDLVFSNPLNIVTLQRSDHERMERLLHSYEIGGNRARAYARIVRFVSTHAFAEENVLFPAARRLLPATDSLTHDIEGKHQQVKNLMIEMQGMAPGEAAFEDRAATLFALLRADAREEEDELLPRLAAATDERHLRSLGVAWAAARFTAPNRPNPSVSRRPPGSVLAGLPLAIYERVRRWLERWQAGATPQRVRG